ncbi:MAG: cation diffusion facilitator family transporter [Sphingomicrobium sp.]
MGGSHDHQHHHAPATFGRAFALGIALNGAFIMAEVAAGLAADSMALLADAGHNLSDVLGLALAWAGAAMASRPSSEQFTYGFKKAPILAALFNAILLLVAVGAILVEGVTRLVHPEEANGSIVMLVAGAGIVINGITAWLFASGRKHDLNIRGAYLHMAADAAVSLGVVAAGALILYTGRQWIDPAVSIVVALVILWGTFDLLKQSTGMSLAGVPRGIALAEVEGRLSALEGVRALHDLHIWPMSTTENALTVHLVVPDERSRQRVLGEAKRLLHDDFHLEHVTIQIEAEVDDECVDC